MSSTGIPEKTPLDLQMRLLLKQVDPVIRPRVSIVSFRQTSTDGVQTMDCPGRDQSGARAAHIISLYILPTGKRHGVPGAVEVRAIRSQSRRVAVPSLDLAHGRGPADGMTGVSSRDISEEAIESRTLTGVIKIERDYVEKNLGCSGGLGSTSRASSRGAGRPLPQDLSPSQAPPFSGPGHPAPVKARCGSPAVPFPPPFAPPSKRSCNAGTCRARFLCTGLSFTPPSPSWWPVRPRLRLQNATSIKGGAMSAGSIADVTSPQTDRRVWSAADVLPTRPVSEKRLVRSRVLLLRPHAFGELLSLFRLLCVRGRNAGPPSPDDLFCLRLGFLRLFLRPQLLAVGSWELFPYTLPPGYGGDRKGWAGVVF